MRLINKIKYDGKRVTIDYVLPCNDSEPIEVSIKHKEPPRQTFIDAMRSLVPHISNLTELPDRYLDGADVRGVSLSWTECAAYKTPIMGAVVTIFRAVDTAHSPLVLNTPHQMEFAPSGNEDDDEYCMTPEFANALRCVVREAEAYLDGARLQLGLFDNLEPAEQTV